MSSNYILVSVIIPCYNHGKYLLEAIESVVENIGRHSCEIIIINDGSTDHLTKEVLQEVAIKGYTVINQINQGLAAARNNGIAASKGKYIIPLDSDNKLHSNYLNKAIDIMELDEDISIIYGDAVFFGDRAGLQKIGEFDFIKIIQVNFIDACAVFRRDIWKKTGGYDGKMPYMGNEDWEFWINSFLSGNKLHYLNEVGFYYRVLSDSMSVSTTRPGYEKNKSYIYNKHNAKIIDYLIEENIKQSTIIDYINENKLKSAVKLSLGRKF